MKKRLCEIYDTLLRCFRCMLTRLFWVFPINNNQIMAWNFFGNGYGCNSKYIYNYILSNAMPFKLVWAVKEYGEFPEGVKQVRIYSLKYFYYLAKSKVLIDNQHKNHNFVKRKKQYFIKTWHATLGLKKIGTDNPEFTEKLREVLLWNNSITDLMISNCDYITKKFRRVFLYTGEILECGFPRTDILLENDENVKKKLLEKIGIKNKRVLLYAPTFRSDLGTDCYDVDLERLLQVLEGISKDNWIAIVKLHPHLADKKMYQNSNDILDLTGYDDIQELMAISDVLITDYSNVMFEFALTKRPVFLYCKDYNQYKEQRGYLFDLKELPFDCSLTNDELVDCIYSFDAERYKEKVEDFFGRIGFEEKPNSSQLLVNRITEICNKTY